MIPIVQILQDAATAVETSAGIATFISTNYPGSTLSTFIGENGVNPPSEANAPFIAFLPSLVPFDIGSGTTERTPTFTIGFGLLDDRTTTVAGRTTYTGLVNADTLAGLILTAINTAFGQQEVRVVDYSLDDSLRFPLIQGGMSVTLWFVQGSGEYSLN